MVAKGACTILQKIKNDLGKEVSEHAYHVIHRHVSSIESENDDLRRRLNWLEDAVDNANLEDIFIEYQKSFGIECWSGSAQ